ncbi:MAG: hypothetical protein IMZ62_04945 [Chloroflexi bacterium]|nr:hypothetical protein [Chloroflexota bacterium]
MSSKMGHNATPRGAVPKQGVYEFGDATAGGAPYVGQSGNIPERLKKHEAAGRLTPGSQVATTHVPGDKTDREIAEYNRIQGITGGVPASQSPKVANQRDPIGRNRQHLLRR